MTEYQIFFKSFLNHLNEIIYEAVMHGGDPDYRNEGKLIIKMQIFIDTFLGKNVTIEVINHIPRFVIKKEKDK